MEHYNPIFSKVPTLRFKKYDTNWNRKRLSDYVKKITQKNSNNIIKNVICNSAQNGLIPQLDFFDKEIANDENTVGYYIINNGDFVYNPRKSLNAPYGPVNMYKYEKAGIVSPLYLCFSVDESINKSFLLQRFKSPCWYRYIYLNGDSGARHDRVSIKDDVFLSQPISLPSAEEQTDIAVFLEKIDERIEIQNKIIEDLKILKKELCNDHFKSVLHDASLRYITLKEILTERKEYCSKDGTYTHGTLSKEGVAPKTERYDRDFLVKNEDKQYKVTHLNDICYNPANLKFGVICRNTYGDLIFSPIYVTFEISDNVYPAYIELFLTNPNFIGRIRRYEQGTVYERMAVSPEDFLSYETHIPAYEEQVEFANEMQRIQRKIELETAFLSSLQNQRRFFLNAMFI